MTTVEKIVDLMNRDNLNALNLEKQLGFSNATIASWKSGKAKPSADALKKIADYFNVSVDYLLGRTDEPTPVTTDIDPDSIRFALYEGDKKILTESDKSEIENFVRFVVEKRKKENETK